MKLGGGVVNSDDFYFAGAVTETVRACQTFADCVAFGCRIESDREKQKLLSNADVPLIDISENDQYLQVWCGDLGGARLGGILSSLFGNSPTRTHAHTPHTQALADSYVIRDGLGTLSHTRVTFIGDLKNNFVLQNLVCRS
jgi:ornithine carbamoyltransferase